MTKRRSTYPWPRLMKAVDAANYIGTSATNFRRLVDRGQLAQPFERGGERLWDIRDLDEHAESLSRTGEPISGEWSGQAL